MAQRILKVAPFYANMCVWRGSFLRIIYLLADLALLGTAAVFLLTYCTFSLAATLGL